MNDVSKGIWHMGARRRLLSAVVRFLPSSVLITVIAWIHRRVEPELPIAIKKCSAKGVVLDVGAWYGPYSYWLSKKSLWVHAFEPNPEVADTLMALKRKNVTVHPTAVSNINGIANLYLSGSGKGTEAQSSLIENSDCDNQLSIKVPTLSIDSLEIKNVELIKIDVEGHEESVVRGAIKTICKYHPVLLVELEDRYADIASTISFLENLGYSGSILINKKWRLLSSFNLKKWQQQFHENSKIRGYLSAFVFGYGYVNNVFFVHEKSPWTPFGSD